MASDPDWEANLVHSVANKSPRLESPNRGIRYFARLIRKRLLFIVAIVFLSVGGTKVLLDRVTPTYRAVATVSFEATTDIPAFAPEVVSGQNRGSRHQKTEEALLRTLRVARRVVVDNCLWTDTELSDRPSGVGDCETQPESGEIDRIAQAFRSRVSILPIGQTRLVGVGFDSTDPKRSARLANLLIEAYVAEYLDSEDSDASALNQWMADRVADLSANVEAAERAISDFREDNDLIGGGGPVARLDERELFFLSRERLEASSALARARAEQRAVDAVVDAPELAETVAVVAADPLVRRLIVERDQLRGELATVGARYGERHPIVLDIDARLESNDRELAVHVRRISGATRDQARLAAERISALDQEFEERASGLNGSDSRRFEVADLERELEQAIKLRDGFARHVAVTSALDGFTSLPLTVVDEALPPGRPISPRKTLILAAIAASSAVLALFLALILEGANRIVRGIGDIESAAGLPVIGVLPKRRLLFKLPLWLRSSRPITPEQYLSTPGVHRNAVASIASHIRVTSRLNSCELVLSTSSVPGEGKSTTSLNLAWMLGSHGRVLLIDADLRRSHLNEVLEIASDKPGLADLILGEGWNSNIVRKVLGGRFDFLPTGVQREQPLEMLGSEKMAAILSQLRHHYDYIIVDSPPVLAVADAQRLTPLCDRVLFAVRSDHTDLGQATRALELLRRVGARFAGVVVTHVPINRLEAYGNYGNRYRSYEQVVNKEVDAKIEDRESMNRQFSDGRSCHPEKLVSQLTTATEHTAKDPYTADNTEGRVAATRL